MPIRKRVYDIVCSDFYADSEVQDFEKRVTVMLEEGWLLQGGVALSRRDDGSIYYVQALVKVLWLRWR